MQKAFDIDETAAREEARWFRRGLFQLRRVRAKMRNQGSIPRSRAVRELVGFLAEDPAPDGSDSEDAGEEVIHVVQ